MGDDNEESVYLPIEVSLTAGDDLSETATMRLRNKETDVVYDLSGPFVDGVAFLTSDDAETPIPPGTYSYQYMEYLQDAENPYIYPNPEGCDGECELPTLIICESIPDPEGS